MSRPVSAPLADLLVDRTVSYGIVQPGIHEANGVPIVRVKDIRNGTIAARAPLKVSAEVANPYGRTQLSGGELLVSLVGTVGETAVVPRELAGWNVARAVAVVRPQRVTSNWLHYAFQTPEVRQQVRAALNTTVQSTLNLSDLKRVVVPVADERSMASITEVLRALDDKIAANAELARTADDLARALFTRQLERGGTPVMLSTFATVVLGGTPSRSNTAYWSNGTVPWINSGAANSRAIHVPNELITGEALRVSAAKLMPRRATVVAITGATLGQVARLEIEASGNQSLTGIWSDRESLNDWIYFAIQERMPEILGHATGAAQQHINKQVIDRLVIDVPPDDDLERWAKTARPLLDRAAAAGTESLTLAELRDTLLPHLMSGRLTVRDAEKTVSDAV